ncbi:uncharacterized protein KLTH0E15818g [Lachancea thermotolerans CBS 6340]|uniref:KLTH0E15818p n=1 Tax=Lachancea thermotolerans (strain ATCC 56472 / CBS 6340 / NRRL Y-8284) TaxID=559295 RepID=C5DIX0_LACTC|nr:KLTH0E15818p [Lachancea thermotolerans CBS 6340]CAR23731.1 KLTH0E15818p [Lachancea thermotolerans CBS 6340]
MDEDAVRSSFISQDTHSSLLLMNKSHSDASYGPVSGETPVRWQTGNREFHFNSNSTPSKGTDAPLEDPARKLLRKRRIVRNTLSGAKPRLRSKLSGSAAKLDLLDDQVLTSLPIPPPKEKHYNATESHVNEVQMRIHKDNRRISIAPKRQHSEAESAHPIVLVEDYIPQDPSQLRFAKNRVSVSDLKSKISKSKISRLPIKLKDNRSASAASSLTLTPHINDDDSFANMGMISEDDECVENQNLAFDQHSTETGKTAVADIEHLLEGVLKPSFRGSKDEYLQAFNLEEKIKGCVICEKPLYEISTLLEGRHFREIVCSSCTLRYEETAKILEDYEFETSYDSIDSSRDCSINSEDLLEETEPAIPIANKRFKANTFSPHLINRLQLQIQNIPEKEKSRDEHTVDSKTMLWFIEAKRKLRWRWRVNGLIPQFLAGKRNI